MKINKEQKIIERLKKYGDFSFTDIKPKERTEILSLIVFVEDTRRLHDSGYPFIRIFGEIEKGKLIDLGWHDHYLINIKVNIDSFGKNIFHIMNWDRNNKPFWICGNNIWCSTFEIKENGELR